MLSLQMSPSVSGFSGFVPRQTKNFYSFTRDGLTGRECEGKTLLVVGVLFDTQDEGFLGSRYPQFIIPVIVIIIGFIFISSSNVGIFSSTGNSLNFFGIILSSQDFQLLLVLTIVIGVIVFTYNSLKTGGTQ